MKMIMTFVFASLLMASPLVMVEAAHAAPSDRQEVAQRLELNQCTAEELAATGAVSLDLAKKIIELRDQFGSFQGYEDLEELEIPEEQLNKLRYNTTIQGIASDCNC